jgi:hypothetical protein
VAPRLKSRYPHLAGGELYSYMLGYGDPRVEICPLSSLELRSEVINNFKVTL